MEMSGQLLPSGTFTWEIPLHPAVWGPRVRLGMVTKKKIPAGYLTCTVQPRKHSLDPFRLTYDSVPACTGLLICHCCSDKGPCQDALH